MKKIESITSKAFEPFGTVLEFPEGNTEQFYIVDSDKENPWRIAVFRYSNKSIKVIENHPTSKESFEPLKGVTLLLVAENKTPEDYKVFILDKPICLKKGVWHQVMALTPEAEVKITENFDVESVYYEFEEEKVIGIN